MKNFLSIGTNKLATLNAEKKQFSLVSELVINIYEVGYEMEVHGKDDYTINKKPELSTFKFLANVEQLKQLRDRIQQEIEELENISTDLHTEE